MSNITEFMNLLITSYGIRLKNQEITEEQYEEAIDNLCDYYSSNYIGYVN